MDTEVAAEILRERCGVTGPVTVHETWGASVVVEIDGLFLTANGDRSTAAEALVAQRVRAAGVPAPEIWALRELHVHVVVLVAAVEGAADQPGRVWKEIGSQGLWWTASSPEM